MLSQPKTDQRDPNNEKWFAMTSDLELVALTKRYDDALAVDAISHRFKTGGYACLLGPSGCGKTSTLRMIAGHETVTDGAVILQNKDISLMPPARRGTAMMFQNYALFPHLNIIDNVAFSLKMKGVTRSDRHKKAAEILELVDMETFHKRFPDQLSGGQQQRVALARALVFEPELVLMDEPLGALDKQLREHMQFEITRLAHDLGITVVYVTHDQTEALTMSDRVAVFNDGRIQQLAPPASLYEAPQNSFVAQFIGENNTMEGIVTEISGDKCVVKLDDGELIDAKPVNVSKVGERTRVSIRPERVEMNKSRLQPGAHTLKATVREFIYMGDIFRTRLSVAGNDNFIIKTRNAPDAVRLEPGAEIEIGWLPQDCRALDA